MEHRHLRQSAIDGTFVVLSETGELTLSMRSQRTRVGLEHQRFSDARFHPLSDRHLFALSRDGLYLFDVLRPDASVPEDEFLFPAGAFDSPPVSLSFGAARGWELLAVFVGCASGSVYYVLPLLPDGCLLPSADWEELLLLAERGDSLHSEAPRSKAWLRSCFLEVTGEPDWVRYCPDTRWSAHSAGLWLAPVLQGPIHTTPQLDRAGCGSLAGMTMLPASLFELPCAVLAFETGRLLTCVATEPLVPVWGRPARSVYGSPGARSPQGAASGSSAGGLPRSWGELRRAPPGAFSVSPEQEAGEGAELAMPWLVVEALTLGLEAPTPASRRALTDGKGGLPASAQPTPFMFSDPTQPDILWFASSHAVHAIRCGWMAAARRALEPLLGDHYALSVLASESSGQTSSPASSSVREVFYDANCEVVGAAACPAHLSAPESSGGAAEANDPTALLVWTSAAPLASSAAAGGAAQPPLPPTQMRTLKFSAAEAYPAPCLEAGEGGLGMRAAAAAARDDVEPPRGIDSVPPFATVSAAYDGTLARISRGAGFLSASILQSQEPIDSITTAAESAHLAIDALRMLQAKLAARAALVAASAQAAETTIASLQAEVARAAAHADASRQRLELLSAGSQNLRARAHAILFALALRRGQLSRAEEVHCAEMAALHEEMTGKATAMIRRLEASIGQLGSEEKEKADPGAAVPSSVLDSIQSDLDAVAETARRAEGALQGLRLSVPRPPAQLLPRERE